MDREILKKVSFFDTLNDDELRKVHGVAKEERFKADDSIFQEGDKGDKLYVILEGAVRISKTIPGAGEEALGILRAGSYFGEMAVIEDEPRSAHAITHEDATLVSVSKKDLEELMEKDKELGYKLLRKFVETLSQRLRDTNNKIQSFFAMTGGF